MRKPVKPQRPRMPWEAVMLAPHEVYALKGISPQAMAVIEKLTGGGGSSGNPFTPGGEDGRRATDFGCGKLWVGNTIREVRAAAMPGPKPKGEGPDAVPVGPEPSH